MNINQIFSFISDPRLPIYYPFSVLRSKSTINKLNAVTLGDKIELDIIFTCDIEQDYGSLGDGNTKYVLPFLTQLRSFFQKFNISRSDLFVQGNLIEEFATPLKNLGKNHSVGLHAYAHEPWGESWFVKHICPSYLERLELMKKSLSAFERASFPKPISFRAPNMVLSKSSMGILIKNEFTIDSSYPSYSGGLPLSRSLGTLREYPVSFDPIPSFGKLGMSHFSVFNTYNLVCGSLKGDNLIPAVERLAKMQILHDQKPLLVILTHPWEFFDSYSNDSRTNYSSDKNFALVGTALKSLQKRFSPSFVSMQTLGRVDLAQKEKFM